MSTVFDRDATMAAVEAAVAANPEGRNPMDGDTCLNRAIEPDADTPRCIASQVHFDLTGRELHGPNSEGIFSSLEITYRGSSEPFGTDAVSLLDLAQDVFDRQTANGSTWTTALAYLKECLAD